MYYGIADKFLLDNQLKKSNSGIVRNHSYWHLIQSESTSMADVMKIIVANYKSELKNAIKSYSKRGQSVNMSQAAFIASSMGSKYIVKYEKTVDGIKILEKRDVKSDDIDKYAILC